MGLNYLSLLMASVLLSLACVASRVAPRETASFVLASGGLPSPRDLEIALNDLLEAHRKCVFPDEVQIRIPDLPRPWIEIEELAHSCLGKLMVTSETVETPDLVSFELAPVVGRRGRPGDETYVIFAGFVGERWLLSWPTPLGPPLHAAPKRPPR